MGTNFLRGIRRAKKKTGAGENNKEFGFVSALRLNLVQFNLWAILSPLVFRFSRRFPIELRPLNVRNLLLYFPALI